MDLGEVFTVGFKEVSTHYKHPVYFYISNSATPKLTGYEVRFSIS